MAEQTDGALADLAGVTLTDPTGAVCPLHRHDRPTLVAVATLQAGERAFALGAAVREAVDSSRLAITLVADLSGMSLLARATLRHQLRAIREDIEDWLADTQPDDTHDDPWAALALLADWDGEVTRRLGFDRDGDQPLFLVASADGEVLASLTPAADHELVAVVLQVLDPAA